VVKSGLPAMLLAHEQDELSVIFADDSASCTEARSCTPHVTLIAVAGSKDEAAGMMHDKMFDDLLIAGECTPALVERTVEFSLERRRIQQEHAAELAKLGGCLAERMVHQLSNPLTLVLVTAQYLMRQSEQTSSIYSRMKKIEEAVHRCRNILDTLLMEYTKSME
jgi:signal transduction histidine kinase